ncbi:hypothetical protein [Gillisia hiemivivida]|jgi:hypothetical protein|uniref:STAS/SEC14 domain-containing protein n=1 Tax=Gillisia hiemivivida TaxID=291190 RepID=A0A5C6ZWN9_9FLAO|nr:hypothetical protein [Gillisia hiemivivida]TXD95138.1 hypothetical protein ES724_03020 [Gillisia hiemivivida]
MINSALELQFGSVTFFENIQIAELNEGILFDIPHNQEILELARERFNNNPYGYISNRVNSYSVNPMIHLESANVSNLIAIAIVSRNPVVKQNCIIEKQFFRNSSSFEVFETLEEAVNWMKHQLI